MSDGILLVLPILALIGALMLRARVRARWSANDAYWAAYARTTVAGIDAFGLDAAGRAALEACAKAAEKQRTEAESQ